MPEYEDPKSGWKIYHDRSTGQDCGLLVRGEVVWARCPDYAYALMIYKAVVRDAGSQ